MQHRKALNIIKKVAFISTYEKAPLRNSLRAKESTPPHLRAGRLPGVSARWNYCPDHTNKASNSK